MKNYIVFIGRFQPFTIAHKKVLDFAVDQNPDSEIIFVLGSAKSAPNIKNPFIYEERIEIIKSYFTDISNLHFVGVRDYYYNDVKWMTEIKNKVNQITGHEANISIVGHYKDDSSYYLKYFNEWELIECDSIEDNNKIISASDVRKALFEKTPLNCLISTECKAVIKKLTLKKKSNWDNLVEEHNYIKKYKEQYKDAPYPPIFVTADSLVLMAGHILLVKRKFNPGKDLYALPGGFIKDNEKIVDSAIRELLEETKIEVENVQDWVFNEFMKKHVVNNHVFDHPNRSLRGRVITHAYMFDLNDEDNLPKIKADDDAKEVIWMPIMDIFSMEKEFFEDHFHIINYFLNKY